MYKYVYIHLYIYIYIYMYTLGSSARFARKLGPCFRALPSCGPPAPLWAGLLCAGPLWAPLCHCGPPGPLWAMPVWAPLGPSVGAPWALVGRALVVRAGPV